MSRLLKAARCVRHAAALRWANPLWNRLRPLYHWSIDPRQRGVPIRMGSNTVLKVPAVFTGALENWDHYEPECVDAITAWATAHPTGIMLDIGCAIGIFSALALQSSPDLRVVAIDADDVSLAYTRQFAGRDAGRLSLLWALLDKNQQTAIKWNSALTQTNDHLAKSNFKPTQSKTRYVCLEDPNAATHPRYSLDGLDVSAALPPGPILMKCDVEGAELLVLQGATEFLDVRKPTLLISVHPPALPIHRHTVEDIMRFLKKHCYRWRVIACDHEEHWLAQPDI